MAEEISNDPIPAIKIYPFDLSKFAIEEAFREAVNGDSTYNLIEDFTYSTIYPDKKWFILGIKYPDRKKSKYYFHFAEGPPKWLKSKDTCNVVLTDIIYKGRIIDGSEFHGMKDTAKKSMIADFAAFISEGVTKSKTFSIQIDTLERTSTGIPWKTIVTKRGPDNTPHIIDTVYNLDTVSMPTSIPDNF